MTSHTQDCQDDRHDTGQTGCSCARPIAPPIGGGFAELPDAMAQALNDALAGSEVTHLCDLLAHAVEGCTEAAEQLDYLQKLEGEDSRAYGREEDPARGEAAAAFSDTAAKLTAIVEATRAVNVAMGTA